CLVKGRKGKVCVVISVTIITKYEKLNVVLVPAGSQRFTFVNVVLKRFGFDQVSANIIISEAMKVGSQEIF
ncbi:Ribosomal RNA small subunit methyltransferase G, partial [Frankliniella fusca]